MDPNELVSRNVVVIPTTEVSSRAQSVSRLLEPFGTEFTLGEGALPHLSLYQAAYPLRNEEMLFASVRQIASTVQPFPVTLEGFSSFWDTFIFWNAVRGQQLTELHLRLLNTLNPLREQRLLPIHQTLLADESIPQRLRESIQMYGNPLCGDEERPHVTITRLTTADHMERALALLMTNAPEALTFSAGEFVVADVGSHGTCPRLLASFPISGG